MCVRELCNDGAHECKYVEVCDCYALPAIGVRAVAVGMMHVMIRMVPVLLVIPPPLSMFMRPDVHMSVVGVVDVVAVWSMVVFVLMPTVMAALRSWTRPLPRDSKEAFMSWTVSILTLPLSFLTGLQHIHLIGRVNVNKF